ncbi:MAG TPA: hypothetical protein VFM44_11975 [Gemmatimonadota bacterium]|nr:hypothetical protein [Gemmatimonadota bacterium]
MLRRLLPGVAAISLFMACTIAIGGDDESPPREFTVHGSFDHVWEAVITAFADLDLPIAPPQRDSGVVTTDWILLEDPDRFMNCEGDARAQEGRYNVIVRETPAAAGTRVTMTTSYRAVNEGVAARCASTGEMEERLRGRIEDIVDSERES